VIPNRIGQRQAGDLGGRLATDPVGVRVVIEVGDEFANFASVQHLVWMLVNLLSRQPEEVRHINLDMPAELRTIDHISPLVEDGRFVTRVMEAARRINTSLAEHIDQTIHRETVFIRVGPGELRPDGFSIALSCDNWSGYAGTEQVDLITDSPNPIGSYVAACLGAGEVFKFARPIKSGHGSFTKGVWLNAYNLSLTGELIPSPPLSVIEVIPKIVLAGVGAVGAGFLHLLYALPDLRAYIDAIDGDPEGVTSSNLNRYAIFDTRHTESLHLKASTAASFFSERGTRLAPFDMSWEAWRRAGHPVPDVVISAVDSNAARHAIQDSMPRTILGASTNELKLQVNYYDVSDPASACLKCRNPIGTSSVPDDTVVQDLKAFGDEELFDAAQKMNVSVEDLRTFLSDPKKNCGLISGASLQKFATVADIGAWSVGFVSVLAGVLLGAEFLKQTGGGATRMTSTANLYRFQFWHPGNGAVNRLTSARPETSCICRTPYYQAAVGALSSACD
jgi:hypothetical protein